MKNILLILSVFLFITVSSYADSNIAALECVDSFFTNLQNRKYKEAWESLTPSSQERIIKDIRESYKKEGEKVPSGKDIESDFAVCGTICNGYWSGFIKYFDPKEALDNSTWSIGTTKKDYAEINLLHKNSKSPAVVKVYRKDGTWKMGLTESFWLRKYFQD